MRAETDNDPALATLLRRREEVKAWLDGPAKKVTLTALEREIAELDRATEAPPKTAAVSSPERREIN